MKWTLKLVAEVVPGKPTEYEVATIERIEKFSPATVGLMISDGKAILAGLQKQMVTAQVQHHGASIHSCPGCGKTFRTKGYSQSTLRSVYGNVGMRIRRLRGCSCVGARQNSFSAMFTNKDPTTPELKYLTAKLAALLPFGKVADFLGELRADNAEHGTQPDHEGRKEASEIGGGPSGTLEGGSMRRSHCRPGWWIREIPSSTARAQF